MGIIKVATGSKFLHGSKANLGSKSKAKNNLVKACKLYKGKTPNVKEGFQIYKKIQIWGSFKTKSTGFKEIATAAFSSM